MMSEFKQGEYIYIPAEVPLYQFTNYEKEEGLRHYNPGLGGQPFIKRSYVTKAPHHLMFIKESRDNQYLKVFYNGELWSVKSDHAYAIKEAQ